MESMDENINEMKPKTKFVVGILVVLLVVVVGGYYIYKDVTSVRGRISDVDESSDKEYNSSGVKIIELPKEGKLPEAPQPDLGKALTFASYLNPEAVSIYEGKIEKIRAKLKETPTNFQLWMELATNYKAIGEYKYAEEVWYYAHLMIPDNAVVMGNLGNLYAYELKDNVKAEEYFVKAINAPGALVYLYFQIADFYLDIMNDKAKAIGAVEQGLEKIPGDDDLESLLEAIKADTY